MIIGQNTVYPEVKASLLYMQTIPVEICTFKNVNLPTFEDMTQMILKQHINAVEGNEHFVPHCPLVSEGEDSLASIAGSCFIRSMTSNSNLLFSLFLRTQNSANRLNHTVNILSEQFSLAQICNWSGFAGILLSWNDGCNPSSIKSNSIHLHSSRSNTWKTWPVYSVPTYKCNSPAIRGNFFNMVSF